MGQVYLSDKQFREPSVDLVRVGGDRRAVGQPDADPPGVDGGVTRQQRSPQSGLLGAGHPTGRLVDQRQAPVVLDALLVDEQRVDRLAEHRLHRVAVQRSYVHLHALVGSCS